MKLADSWVEESPAPISGGFHEEVEEVDEDDEAKDGCGGVGWQHYVLKRPNTSNKMLHELAREIRGVERRRGKRLKPLQYKTVFDKWEAASNPFLRVGKDYYTEFLAKLDCVRVPKGETLKAAFERAKSSPLPAVALLHKNKDVHLFASLCRELQEMAGDQPIMLHQKSVGRLFGHSHHRNISNWIKALKTLGLLEIAEHGRPGRSSRYFYVTA